MEAKVGRSSERGTPIDAELDQEGNVRGPELPQTTTSIDPRPRASVPPAGGGGRREFLTGAGVIGAIALAGCSEALYPQTPTDPPRRERTPRPTPRRTPQSTPRPPTNRYRLVRDASGNIEVEIPTTWTDIDGSPWERGPRLVASTSIDDYWNTFTVPGVSISASREPGVNLDDVLDDMGWQNCTSFRRDDYDDSVYTGRQEILDCSGGDTVIWNIVALPADRSYLIRVEGQALTESDMEALGVVAETFFVYGV
jgi:hypothetical protein